MYIQNQTLLSVKYRAPVISIIHQTSCMLNNYNNMHTYNCILPSNAELYLEYPPLQLQMAVCTQIKVCLSKFIIEKKLLLLTYSMTLKHHDQLALLMNLSCSSTPN